MASRMASMSRSRGSDRSPVLKSRMPVADLSHSRGSDRSLGSSAAKPGVTSGVGVVATATVSGPRRAAPKAAPKNFGGKNFGGEAAPLLGVPEPAPGAGRPRSAGSGSPHRRPRSAERKRAPRRSKGRVDRGMRHRTQLGNTRRPGHVEDKYNAELSTAKARAQADLAERRKLAAERRARCKLAKKVFGSCMKYETVHELNEVSQVVWTALMLADKDFVSFAKAFDSVDIDNSLTMDFSEFFEMVDEKRSPYSDYLFTTSTDPTTHIVVMSDAERDAIEADVGERPAKIRGNLSFNDFIQTATTYCMYTRDDILQFAFRAFDADGSGFIEEEEFVELCAAVNNMNPTYPGNFTTAMQDFDQNKDGVIDFGEFKSLNERFPLVLFPAFRLQDALQRGTLGSDRWIKIQEGQKKYRELDQYRAMHGGSLPRRPLWKRVLSCGHDPRYADFGFAKPGAKVTPAAAPPAASGSTSIVGTPGATQPRRAAAIK